MLTLVAVGIAVLSFIAGFTIGNQYGFTNGAIAMRNYLVDYLEQIQKVQRACKAKDLYPDKPEVKNEL